MDGVWELGCSHVLGTSSSGAHVPFRGVAALGSPQVHSWKTQVTEMSVQRTVVLNRCPVSLGTFGKVLSGFLVARIGRREATLLNT